MRDTNLLFSPTPPDYFGLWVNLFPAGKITILQLLVIFYFWAWFLANTFAPFLFSPFPSFLALIFSNMELHQMLFINLSAYFFCKTVINFNRSHVARSAYIPLKMDSSGMAHHCFSFVYHVADSDIFLKQPSKYSRYCDLSLINISRCFSLIVPLPSIMAPPDISQLCCSWHCCDQWIYFFLEELGIVWVLCLISQLPPPSSI